MTELRISRPVRLFAPAKVNLGLEVIGRRSSGFHEVVTILETVSLFDVIDVIPSSHLSVDSGDCVNQDDDLILKAIRAVERETGRSILFSVKLTKRIPIAAGLGGGSSDAGTVLAFLSRLTELPADSVLAIAAELGSDVPFFLEGGVSIATGTGVDIEPVNPRGRRWYVIVTPDLEIPGKTATLYRKLKPEDFSDGTSTWRVADQISRFESIDPDALVNVFQRPLREFEAFNNARQALLDAGASFAIPSGAGPAVFTMCESIQHAKHIVPRIRQTRYQAFIATSVAPNLNEART
jgi:4-diphosphocytidyl-2-C-methyl-D-erythritol kinase